MTRQLVASSKTEAGLIKLVNEYFFSTNYIIKDEKAYNTKLERYYGVVVREDGRYKFYI